ncbi:phosphatidate cytidylyltransferase [Luteimonas fraxinea]|uniref:Phosphatidate cytidylyltransferase n=1 Tax=Luteimonas fraxinea TaxID=2901869 RepID=A0ABS8UI59_9GAMM|nr:phosphatidate cytidylyltransferase [Luteimonas fraxinea]MCD9098416.1 phosphatidate cytidylyltransferase [Luteimonas fraxinea]UHH10527.1 phosphatidate cytidylyltransferase [Luteimonas fraxinea]
MTSTRILAALLMAPVAIAAVLLLNTPWMAAVSAIIFLAALWEWLRLTDIDDTLARTALLALNLLLMVAVVWASATGGGSLVLLKILAMIGVVWWLLATLWLRHYDFASDHDTKARVFKLAAGTLAVIPAWAALCVIHAGENGGHGNRWLLLALAIVWATDTGAYFAGRKFGKHKLAPRISPNKTVEGLAGGVVAGVVVAVAFAPLAGATVAQLPLVALVAVLTVLASVVGDLFESLLKRHVGAKDSGTLIPGHGGVLDRLDSVLAALPVFAFGQIWLGF